MKIIYLAALLIISACSPLKNQTIYTGENVKDIAIYNAISDFSSNCKLFKIDSIFMVNFDDSVFHKGIIMRINEKEYEDRRTHEFKRGELYDGIVAVSIGISSDYQFYYSEEYSRGLPTRYIIKENKLFYWWDDNYPLSNEIIAVLWKYNLLQTELIIPEFSTNDSQKGADYYFCKDDLSKYKRKITNIGLGYYEPPKIKCSKK